MSVRILYSNDADGASAARAAIAAIMARHDSSIERIEDGKLALSEATSIICDGNADGDLTVHLDAHEHGIRARIDGDRACTLGGSEMAWTVLEAVCDQLSETDCGLTFEIGWR